MTGYLISLLIGWAVGALANWAADSLPHLGRASAAPRPFEPRHDATLWWYPFQRGYCLHCGTARGLRPPLMELAMALLFALQWELFGGQPLMLLIAWAYAAFLLLVLVIDIEHRRVLNVMLAPAAVALLLISGLPGGISPLDALLGGAAGLALFLLIRRLGRGAMGMGDVKLAGVIGLMTGFPSVVHALLLGIMLGGAAAALLLLTRRAGRGSTIAYAPYLTIGALVIFLRQFVA